MDSSKLKKACHDLRNPLNTISVNADLAKLTLDSNGDPSIANNAVTVIAQECKKLSKLIALIESDAETK